MVFVPSSDSEFVGRTCILLVFLNYVFYFFCSFHKPLFRTNNGDVWVFVVLSKNAEALECVQILPALASPFLIDISHTFDLFFCLFIAGAAYGSLSFQG